MHFIADLHIHSHYSIATSKEGNPENFHRWACLKGSTVIGTGDFTHPGWFEELKEKLEPAEEGLYQLKPAYRTSVEAEIPGACRGEVRFVLSVEISSIYKKNGRTRKIHHLVLMPDFEAAGRFRTKLDEIGNIRSDGRPILGLDSRDLLDMALTACPDVLFIPAHIWTPHFALFGANSGFDTIEECYEDLTPHIYAVETGLSSDPPMNWRLSALDEYALVSHSDAHSPRNLAREADLFNTDLSYSAICSALKDRGPARFLGTLEFYPEEGKYHYDGHRACGVRWKPSETRAAGGRCPVCGKKVTVGVLHRVEVLADRPEGVHPDTARSYGSLIPLPELIADIMGVGSSSSKKVQAAYSHLLQRLGPELFILRNVPIEDIAHVGGAVLAEGIRRLRAGEVEILPGYDGEYGHIRVFRPDERAHVIGQTSLFGMAVSKSKKGQKAKSAASGPSAQAPLPVPTIKPDRPDHGDTSPSDLAVPKSLLSGLNSEQRTAVTFEQGPVIIAAGPGTGKTRTLSYRVAHLILHRNVPPDRICAVTFTNKAAEEMRHRVHTLLPPMADLSGIWIGTFHRLGLDLLRIFSPDRDFAVVDDLEARSLLKEVLSEEGIERDARDVFEMLSRAKGKGVGPDAFEGPDEVRRAYRVYQHRLRAFRLWDYDDLLFETIRLFEEHPDMLDRCRDRFQHLLVDEFQDVNGLQYRLVQLLSGDGRNLFVIGDPDQAIYGFRGADYRYFLRLTEDFPRAQLVKLETTYRSTESILRAATAVIQHNPDRVDLTLKPIRDRGTVIRLLTPVSELAEGIAIVREIGRMVGGATMLQAHGQGGKRTLGNTASEERSFGDIAVLFRTGRQADMLGECFLKEGIPYRIIGQKSFLEARSVRDLLAFFHVALHPGDDFRMRNVLRSPPFYPGSTALKVIYAHQKAQGDRLIEAVRGVLSRGMLRSGPVEKLRDLTDAMERYRTQMQTESARPILTRWIEEREIELDEALSRLLRVADRFTSVPDLLEQLPLYADGDYEQVGTGGSPTEAVTLMTLHAAKGLEFPVVFIAGAEDGLIPYREKDSDLTEERRLFYVGMSRAQDELVLLAARARMHYGRRIENTVSPFVREIPDDLIKKERSEHRRKKKPKGEQLNLW